MTEFSTNKRQRTNVILIWLLCLTQGLLFIVATPLWEGWDEPFHYSYIQIIAEHHTLPVFGQSIVSKEIAESFQNAPLSSALNSNVGNLFVTYDQYWRETPQARLEKWERLKTIPDADKSEIPDSPYQFQSYESLHAPLYYSLSALIYSVFSSSDLLTRVFVLRAFSLFLGSLTIWIAFSSAAYVFKEGRFLVCVPLILALSPGLYSAVGRISNDCLAVLLFSLLVLATLKYFAGHETNRQAVYIGISLGLGLLTKAYFLSALPAIAVLFILACFAGRPVQRTVAHAGIVGVLAVAIAGWWYVRNFVLYGNLSGMQEITLTRQLSFLDRIRAIGSVPWLTDIKEMTTQHIWIGNNSYLRLSGATYNVGFVLIALAILGVILSRIPSPKGRGLGEGLKIDSPIFILSIFYLFFIGALLYHMLVTFVHAGLPGGTSGWYLYAAIVPEIILLVYGVDSILRRLWKRPEILLVAYAFVVSFLSFFCKAIPAYAGFSIAHFHLRDFITIYSPWNLSILLDHLSLNRPSFVSPIFIGLLIGFDVLLMVFTVIRSGRSLLKA